MASTVYQNRLKKTHFFCQKVLKFCAVWTMRFCSNFTSMRYNFFFFWFKEDFRLPMSALAMVTTRESFNRKYTAKNWFSNWVFYVTIADADIGSQKSLYTLFDECLDHILVKFEQNHMVQTTQNFQLFDKKWHFDKLQYHLEDVSVTEAIIWC